MQLLRLEVDDFRNLVAVVVEPDQRFNVFSGDNAQGKTSLLEAVHVLLNRRSFRRARTGELIRFGAPSALLRATVRCADLEYDLRFQIFENSRRLQLDGKAVRAPAWPHGLAAVIFTPDDLSIPKGPPAERRRLLDQAVATVWPAYGDLTRDYGRVLAARNRLLREPRRDAALLEVYDEQLAQLGAKVTATRLRYLRALSPEIVEAFDRITDTHQLQLQYRCSVLQDPDALVPPEDIPLLATALRHELAHRRGEDIARRSTGVGPHQDDLEFQLSGHLARNFASQGQLRALVLAFRLAQMADMFQRFGAYPLLLLDDVSSELDARRNNFLFNFINERDIQVFVTTTRPELLPPFSKARHFSVNKGEVTF